MVKTKTGDALSVVFCDKCHSITVPVKKGKIVKMKCRKCGAEKTKEMKNLKITENVKKMKGITILEKDETPLPITDRACPECDHAKAYWWLQQTRSADEPPTQFFRCVKCKHTWREYK
jgi:transcription factor S